MELLVKAGLTPIQVLQGTTKKITDAYDLENTANNSIMILIEGRPDKDIKDITNIRQIWVNKEPIFKSTLKKSKIIDDDIITNKKLIFIPIHPSNIKTHQIETKNSPLLEQNEPIDSKKLFESFVSNFDNTLKTYENKRFAVTGIVTKIGPDIHNKPSVQLSNSIDGRCQILCVFPNTDIYDEISVGDKVIIQGNYLVMSNWYGIVLKKCELQYQ